MSNHPFAKFGIDHLSASSLNLWRAAPGVFALRYIAKIKDESNAAMMRGTSIENGLSVYLRGKSIDEANAAAKKTFDMNKPEGDEEDIETERDLIIPMLKQCTDWTPPSDLTATQIKVEHWLENIPIPLIGFLDFAFESGHDVDLKTTKACPSNPRPDHVRQVSLYRAARKRQGGLLYVTGKKWAYFNIDDDQMERALNDLQSDALSLMSFLSKCNDKRDVISSLPVDYDDYRAPKTRVPLAEILLAG